MRPRRELEKRSSPSNLDKRLSLRVVDGDDGGGGKRPPVAAGIRIFWWRRESLRLFRWAMAGQSRKWMILVATIWVQAFTGTNFDFSSYSSDLKMVLGISQVQLNYLAVASDLGKAFGWSSGLAILHLPLPAVLFMSASMGAIGYGLQWLVVKGIISLPYFVVFLLCLLAGCSICWFNTICFVLCIRNFTVNRAVALSLTISFNGVSAALYTLAVNAVSSSDENLYLLLNAVLPILASLAALIPILRQPPPAAASPSATRRDSLVFRFLYALALFTGINLLLLNFLSSSSTLAARLLFTAALLLLALPLVVPGIVIARSWAHRNMYSSLNAGVEHEEEEDDEDVELRKGLVQENGGRGEGNEEMMRTFGEEHTVRMVIRRVDFWLYYVAYFCGGTMGIVYSNNLGQIAQSLGFTSASLVTLYSLCSFFGRLLSATPDFLRLRFYFARTGWLALALVLTPASLFLLAATPGGYGLRAGTAMIGLSSGFIFAAATSITSELFGPNSFGVNHNLLITNIPLGSLIYGSVAALIYDANGSSTDNSDDASFLADAVVCMGRQCYGETFVLWGCISVVGLAASLALFLRTRSAYNRFERNRMASQLF